MPVWRNDKRISPFWEKATFSKSFGNIIGKKFTKGKGDLANFWFLKTFFFFFSGGQSKIFQGHGDPVETAVILPDGRKSAVGYSDGSMRIFDLRTGEVVHNLSLFKNKAAICAIDSR